MLKSHLNAIEAVLAAQSKAAANAGHPNLRGGPREWFIREFLEGHLPSELEIGQGEIIDAESIAGVPPKDYRPQVDILLYRRDLPKIRYSPNDVAFFVEGVLATIEVKSKLTRDELKQACIAARKLKALTSSFTPRPPNGIRQKIPFTCHVVSYDGPAKMETVTGWLKSIADEIGASRKDVVDMIVVLGRGVTFRLDSVHRLSTSFMASALDQMLRGDDCVRGPDETKIPLPEQWRGAATYFRQLMSTDSFGDWIVENIGEITWLTANQLAGNLQILFAQLLSTAMRNRSQPDVLPYLGSMLDSDARFYFPFGVDPYKLTPLTPD